MPLTKDQMRDYQRKRRQGLQTDVNQEENVNQGAQKPVNQTTVVNRSVTHFFTPWGEMRTKGFCMTCGKHVSGEDNYCKDDCYELRLQAVR